MAFRHHRLHTAVGRSSRRGRACAVTGGGGNAHMSATTRRRTCRQRATGAPGSLPTGMEKGRGGGGGGGGGGGDKYNIAETPITYGGNTVQDFSAPARARGEDGRIPLKNVNPLDDVAGEFLPGAKLEDKCATLLCMYIIGKNAVSGDLINLPEKTDEDEDFVNICIDVARAIDEDDIGFRAPPLFYEMWDQHCDAMEAGKPGESPVVAALESATYDLDKADLRKMAIAEKLPNADQRVKADLVEELNAMLRDISYDLEYDEDCIDEELEVKVLGSFSAAAASGNPVEYIHVRSLTSTEEAVVPKFFEYDASLGPLFQANRRYLEQIQPGSTFVFVTSVGLGPDQTLVFFEARQKKDPIELRIPRRRIRDLCDALVNGAPPLPVGDEPATALSEAVMEEVNASFAGGAVTLTSDAGETIDLMQVEVDEKYLYFPTTLTLPRGFRHAPSLVACYSSVSDGGGERTDASEGQYFEFQGMGDAPGSAVARYSSADGVTIRVLMHRLPFLVRKFTDE